MKRILSVLILMSMAFTVISYASVSTEAASVGYWIDRKGDELNEPYEEAKDDTYENIPGTITSSGAFGIAGATFSLPVGKTAFKLSFDLDWVAPQRFSDASDATKIENFFIFANYTYTAPDQMEPWGGFSAPGPWETWSDGNFTIFANKVNVFPIGDEISSGGQVVTSSIQHIAEGGAMNLPKQGTITITMELKNNVVTLNLKAEDNTDLGTATHTYVPGFFNSNTSRYFAITHFNGAFVFDITNFKIISSDIPGSVGATAGARPEVTSSEPVSSAIQSSASSSAATSDEDSSALASGAQSNDGSVVSEAESAISVSETESMIGSGDENSDTSAGSNDSSNSEGSSASSKDEDAKDGVNTTAIILIAAAAVLIAGAVIGVVLKKKKSNKIN